MRAVNSFRFLCRSMALVVVAALLSVVPWRVPAAQAEPAVARPGAGPVERPLPASAAPNHGLPAGQLAPAVPPGVRAGGPPRELTAQERAARQSAATVRSRVSGTGGGPVQPGAAGNLTLRPGFLLGDTSLVVYFDADVSKGDPASWGRWWATVTDVESGLEQRSAVLGQGDLSECRSPARWCHSFGAADGWALDVNRRYMVTVTVVLPDGLTEATSDPSAPARPRATVTPPSVPAAQVIGCGCATILGPVLATQALRGATVNTATGAFSRTERDLVMPSYGIPFNAARYYSSANPNAGMFGPGWSWTYDAKVVAADGGAVRVRAEDGSEAVYVARSGGGFDAPPGIRSTLSKVDGGWLLRTPDQRTLRFDAAGRLLSVVNARGKGVTLGYDASGLLVTVTDASGRVVKVEWRTDLRMIRKVTLPDDRAVQFDYADGRLLKSQDPRGFVTAYHYDPAGRLDQVVDARGNFAIRNAYDPVTGRVAAQTDPEGGVTAFGWDATKQIATTTDPDNVAVKDAYRDNVLLYSRNANNDVVNHRYDPKLRRGLVVDAKGSQEETKFDDAGNPVERRAPEPFSFTEANTFNDQNNLTTHTDGRKNTWTYEYNAYNELVEQRDPKQPRGKGYRYDYDELGQVKTRTDPRDKVTRYEYDKDGNRTAEVAPTGRRTEMTYDATGRMRSVVDPRGTVAGGNKDAYRTRVVYDEQDRVKEVWQPGKAQPTRTDYDEVGNTKVVTDPLSHSYHYDYDRNSRVIEVKDPLGNVSSRSYTPGGRNRSVTDGERDTTTWTYDAQGRSATETTARGNADPEHKALYTTTFFYDYNGNLIRAERPYGAGGAKAQVDTGFDALDRPTEQRDQMNVATHVGYDEAGNVTSITNERNEGLFQTYDEANRRTGATGATGSAGIDYDEVGNPTKQTSPTGGVTTWGYDDDGRPIAITEPRGNVEGANPADYTTRYGYDLAGNPETVIDPLGHVTKSGYDASNRLVWQTDANNRTTRFGYDDADLLRRVTAPDAPFGEATVYDYNAGNQLKTRTDPRGHTTSLEYDKAGRMIVSTDAIGRRREYVYDPESHLKEQVTARQIDSGQPVRPDPIRPQRTIFYDYDNLGRLVSKRLGADGPLSTFGYDAKNRLTQAADSTGVQERVYDDLGRLKTVTRGEEVFGYDYDGDNRVTTRTYPDGTKITTDYDAGDRVTALTTTKGGTSARYDFGYDVADQLTKVTYPAATGVVEERGYDRAGRLDRIGASRGEQTIAAFDLTLDGVGNPTKITSKRGQAGQPTVTETTAYRYDAVNRLTSACYGTQTCDGSVPERIDYGYDLVGNRRTQQRRTPVENTTTSYDYDDADQLTRETVTGSKSSVRAFEYDFEGNQTRAGDERYTYALDHTMTSATSGGKTTNYTYDAVGNRIAAVTGSGAEQTTQHWSWDVNAGMPLLATETQTTAGGGSSRRDFVYDPAGSPLALLAPDGSAHSLTRDWLGSISAVVAPDGTQEWSYDYDPFGVARGSGLTDGGKKLAPDAPANPMRYAGGYQDTTQGDRYQLRARNYDPTTGRFDAQDPAPAGANEPAISGYAYANNRPTALTDPTGMDPDLGSGMADTYEHYYTNSGTGDPCKDKPEDPQCSTPNPEAANAQKTVDEAGNFVSRIADEIVNLILDLVGFNDAKKCVTEGDIVACISTALQAVPWGKLFKAAKVMVKAVGVGRRLVEAYGKLKAAKAALAKIPKYIRKAQHYADDVAESKKYKEAAEAAAGGAKRTGSEAKATTQKAASGAKQKAEREARHELDEGAESCETAVTRGLHNSFAAGTRVKMADGSSTPIEQVQAGDSVAATDPDTGQTEPRQVTATIEGTGDKRLVDLTLVGAGAGGGGPPAQVTATDGHKFYVPGRGWIPAVELRPGDRLRNDDGEPVAVVATATRTEYTTVHNLTVDTDHTYYVQTGTVSTLVHNCDHIALGKENNGEYGVKKLADKVGARHLMGNTTGWRKELTDHLDAMVTDSSKRVSFEISGIPGNTPASALVQARRAAKGGRLSATQWEILEIEKRGLLDRVEWYNELERWSRPIVWR